MQGSMPVRTPFSTLRLSAMSYCAISLTPSIVMVYQETCGELRGASVSGQTVLMWVWEEQ